MHSIVLERVCVSLGAATPLVDIDATLAGGRCTAVVGPSGTGKTTLLRLLNRLGEPTSGRILLDDRPITDFDVLELRRRVGLVPQHAVLLTDVVADEIRVGQPQLSPQRIDELLTQVGLPTEFAHRRCAELSGGEAQRVCLARALAVRPDVLLLDEPTSALDQVSAGAIGLLIGAHTAAGGSVVLVSHDSGFVGTVADDILMLQDGALTRLDQLDGRKT